MAKLSKDKTLAIKKSAILDAYRWGEWAEDNSHAKTNQLDDGTFIIKLSNEITPHMVAVGVSNEGDSLLAIHDIDPLYWITQISWHYIEFNVLLQEIKLISKQIKVDGNEIKIIVRIPSSNDIISILDEDNHILLTRYYMDEDIPVPALDFFSRVPIKKQK